LFWNRHVEKGGRGKRALEFGEWGCNDGGVRLGYRITTHEIRVPFEVNGVDPELTFGEQAYSILSETSWLVSPIV